MGADFSNAGRARDAGGAGAGFLSYDDVEARLIEAVQLHWRTETCAWPFASDGPWHLILERDLREYTGGQPSSPARMPRIPLGKAEMGRMREAFEWLLLVPDDLDRRIIVLSVTERAKGPKRVPWQVVARRAGGRHEPDALRMRYIRALGALTQRVNRLPRNEQHG
jgi:hypothetical protein